MSACIYSFKKEAKVYLVWNSNQYNIDISEINFSQTITEESYSTKTLHEQNYFEGSKIVKANPANFEFTFPAIRESDLEVVFDRALDVQPFDLYIKTEQDVFKIRNCVITNGTFIIEKLRPLSMTVSGEASQLSWFGESGVAVIPGTPIVRSGTRTYNRVSYVSITLGGTNILDDSLASLNISLENSISWIPYTTVGACAPSVNSLSYPSEFTLDKRALTGSIVRYITDTNNSDLFVWNTDTSLYIIAGQEVGSTIYGFHLDMPNCAITNSINTGEIFTQTYNWRLVQAPENLSDIVTYV